MTNASAGNRTRVTSMATMYSATRPLMLLGSLHATLSSAGELDFSAREMTWLRMVVGLHSHSGNGCSAAQPIWDSRLCCATSVGLVARLHNHSGNRGSAARPIWDCWLGCRATLGLLREGTTCNTGDSSVGRASDCRSLQKSDGPWFDSGSPDMPSWLEGLIHG